MAALCLGKSLWTMEEVLWRLTSLKRKIWTKTSGFRVVRLSVAMIFITYSQFLSLKTYMILAFKTFKLTDIVTNFALLSN